jgi:hypothetical protein
VPRLTPSAIVDFDLSSLVPPDADLSRYSAARVLLRLQGRPLGLAAAPIINGRVDVDALFRDIIESHAAALAAPLVERALEAGAAPQWPDVGALLQCRPGSLGCTPHVTVAIRASGSPSALRTCLEALKQIEYGPFDIVVIDAKSFNERALAGCRGEVLVVVDDSVVLDRGWIGAVARVFVSDPDAMAVTGLVLPREGRASAPEMLTRRWHRGPAVRRHRPASPRPMAVAFWNAGSTTLSLDDVLQAGHTVVYEPAALSWHPRRLVGDPFADPRLAPADIAVRRIDLADTPRSIADAASHQALRLDVSWDGRPIGPVVIAHRGGIVSPFRIQDAIARDLAWDILDTRLRLGRAALRAIFMTELARHLLHGRDAASANACPQWIASHPAAA